MHADPHTRWVIYDDRCRLCSRSVRWLKALDWFRQFRYVGLSDPRILSELGIAPEEALRELKLWDRGRLFGGYAAWVRIASRLPLWFWLTPIGRLPPIEWLGRRAYEWVARHRSCLP